MKITMYLTEDAMQFNLEPENPHEKDFMKILEKYVGPVEIHRGVNIAESRGQYLRDFGERDNILAITIKKAPVQGLDTNPILLCRHSADFYHGAVISKCMDCGGSKIYKE